LVEQKPNFVITLNPIDSQEHANVSVAKKFFVLTSEGENVQGPE
jgi:hypothetical protein